MFFIVFLIQSTKNETFVNTSGLPSAPQAGRPHDTIPTITYLLSSVFDTRAPPESPFKKVYMLIYDEVNKKFRIILNIPRKNNNVCAKLGPS